MVCRRTEGSSKPLMGQEAGEASRRARAGSGLAMIKAGRLRWREHCCLQGVADLSVASMLTLDGARFQPAALTDVW